MGSVKRFIENAFESFLFNSRLVVILAVLGSLTGSVLMFVRGAVLIAQTAKHFLKHITGHDAGEELSIALISSVDSFLFATVLLIFAMGIYELFISKIDPASRTAESRPNWLAIHSLDDLKGAVGKVILMILIVRLFESAVKMKYDHPLHLLYLGLAVLFVAVALYLQHLAHAKKDHDHEAKPYKSEREDAHAHAHAEEKKHEPIEALVTAPPPASPIFAMHPHQPSHAPPAPSHAPPPPVPFSPSELQVAAAPSFSPAPSPPMPFPQAPPHQSGFAPAANGYAMAPSVPPFPRVPSVRG